jgi:adenylate kinase
MKPTMIVFMGGQGSGKGTFAHLLLQQHDYNYVEAGEILRQMPTDSVIGQKILHGELLQDEELFPIMADKIPTDKDLILDGFPRTVGQAKWLIENYADKFDVKVIFLNITEEKMIAHIRKRIKEGGNRADDNDEVAVHKRIAAFKTTTMPAVKWLSELDIVKFYDIHLPSDDIDTNFAHIVKTLK